MTINKISAAQVFCVLLLSRIAGEITFPNMSGMGAENLLSIVLTEVGRFAVALPIIIYSFKGESLYGAIKRKNKFFGWISAVVAAVILLGFAVRSALATAVMVQRTLLIGSGILLTVGLLTLFAAYGVFKGAEALARAGVLFLIAGGAVMAVVILADIPFIGETEYSLGEIHLETLIANITERSMRGGEYLIFAALLPYIVRNKQNRLTAGKAILWFALAGTGAALILTLFAGLVLGDFLSLSEYPYTAAASLSDIAVFKRLDGFFAAIWSLCGAFRCSVMVFGAWAIIAEVLPHRRKSPENSQNGESAA